MWDRLHPIERDGFTSILRVTLTETDLAVEFLVIADRMKARAEGGTG